MEELIIPSGEHALPATLSLPRDAAALIVFVHGSGVDRHHGRAAAIAGRLGEAGFGSASLDLLDEREAREAVNVFDVELQGERLADALGWLRQHFPLPAGLFGAGVGAGAALVAVACEAPAAHAVVCCNGRPDTAGAHLGAVRVPTLLIVEQSDPWNELALERLGGEKALRVVPRPSAPFEGEQLDNIAEQAGEWFRRHLVTETRNGRQDRIREHRADARGRGSSARRGGATR